MVIWEAIKNATHGRGVIVLPARELLDRDGVRLLVSRRKSCNKLEFEWLACGWGVARACTR